MAEESKIEPISLEQEEQRRKKLKLQLKNIENQYQDIYGDIWGDKDKQWEVTTTIEEDLESALKPFSDSGQYNQKELNTIKTHLSNKLKKERASRGMGAGTSDINYPGGKTSLVRDKIQATFGQQASRSRATKRLANFFTQLLTNEKHQYLEFDNNSLINTSLYAQVVPSNNTGGLSYHQDHIYELLNDEDYVEAIIDRGNRENNQSHKLNYVRFYDDKTFGLNTEDKFIEIDGIRKSIDSSGNSKYEVYNLTENKDKDNNYILGENLPLANQDQIDNFEEKLENYEFDHNESEAIKKLAEEKTTSTANVDPVISSSTNSSNVVEDENIKEEVFSNIANTSSFPEDKDEIIALLKEAFLIEHDKNKDGYYSLRALPNFDEGYWEQLKKRGIDFTKWKQLYTSVGEYGSWDIVVNGENGLKYTVYGDPTSPEYTYMDYMSAYERLKTFSASEQIREYTMALAKKSQDLYDTVFNEYGNPDTKLGELFNDKFKKEWDSYIEYFYPEEEDSNIGEYSLLERINNVKMVYIDPNKKNKELTSDEKATQTQLNKIMDIYAKQGIDVEINWNKKERRYMIHSNYANELFSALLNEAASNDQRMIDLNDQNLKKENDFKEQIVAKVEPEYTYLDKSMTRFIHDELLRVGFQDATTWDKKLILDNIWDGLEEYYIRQNPVPEDMAGYEKQKFTINRRKRLKKFKNEYYFMMFHEHLAWVNNKPPEDIHDPATWSVFALKDYCRDLMSPEARKSFGAMRDKARNRGDDKLLHALTMADRLAYKIINFDEKHIKEGASLLSGLIKGEFSDLVPFYGKLVDIHDNTYLKGSADRISNAQELGVLLQKEKDGTIKASEKATLIRLKRERKPSDADYFLQRMVTMNNTMEGKMSDYWWYGAGQAIRHTMPYIAEIWMTGPLFRGTQTKVKAALTARGLGPRWTGVLSWFAGTISLTGGNPQNWVNYTIQNMTPEMTLALNMHEDENSVFDLLNENYTKEMEGGEFTPLKAGDMINMGGKQVSWDPVWTGEDPMPLGEAWARAFAVSWAEMATERAGVYFGPAARYIEPKLLREYRHFIESRVVAHFMKSPRYVRWRQGIGKSMTDKAALLFYVKDNSLSWNGMMGEWMEELINQPLSSIIMGERWNESFINEDGEWDGKFLAEMSISVGVTSGTFSAGNYVRMRRRKVK